MPNEIQFKIPTCYGFDPISKIMKHQHNIVFHLTAETNFVSSSEDVNMNTFNIEFHQMSTKIYEELLMKKKSLSW